MSEYLVSASTESGSLSFVVVTGDDVTPWPEQIRRMALLMPATATWEARPYDGSKR